MDAGKSPGNFPHLDLVRSFAVLLVFFGHLAHTLGYEHGMGTAAHFGVLIFFVHTCLVLFCSMDRLGMQRLFARFYVRRIARIYPIAVASVLFVLFTHMPPAPWLPYSIPNWPRVVANIFLVQNFVGAGHDLLAPLWSLPFEVQMYAVLPMLFLLHKKRGISPTEIWVGVTLFSAALWVLPSKQPADICAYAPVFCAGILAYSSLRAQKTLRFVYLSSGLIGTLVTAIAIGRLGVPVALADAICGLPIGLLIGRQTTLPSSLAKLSELIARYSYSIYLSHLPIMWFCISNGQRHWAAFICLSVAVPIVLYHIIEKPFIDMGVRISAKMQPGGIQEKSLVAGIGV